MLFEFGDVKIDVPDDYLNVITDLAFLKGFNVAEKLQDAEALFEEYGYGVVDLNHVETLELIRLLVEVVE